MKWKNEEKVNINAVFRIEKKYADLEQVFQQVYDTDCYTRWFNWKPFVWLSFDQKYLEEGCKGIIHFTIPPFRYELTVTRVEKNRIIEFQSDGRLFGGTARMEFYEKDRNIYYEDPHILFGKNRLIHKYYCWFLAGKHVPYMESRFQILRKFLLNQQKDISNDENKI